MPNYTFAGCGGEARSVVCGEPEPTEAPTENPANQTGPIFCFPADATCNVEGVGNVPMKNIKLGDKVLVDGTNNYEPVYSFGHRNPSQTVEFLKISTVSHQIALSGDHMVFLEEGKSIPASHVKVGDTLQLAKNGNEQVINTERIKKKGVFAPFTSSGTIIVDGVKASTFVAFQDSDTLILSGLDTGISYQFIAHTFEMPHRLWCRHLSACLEENYTTDGISTWVALPHAFSRWLLKQNDFVITVISLPLLLLFGIFGNLQSLSLLLTVLITTWRLRATLSLYVKSA